MARELMLREGWPRPDIDCPLANKIELRSDAYDSNPIIGFSRAITRMRSWTSSALVREGSQGPCRHALLIIDKQNAVDCTITVLTSHVCAVHNKATRYALAVRCP